MIVKMRKLNLAALAYDRDGILNALSRTNAVQVREHAEVEGTSPVPAGGEELRAYLASLEGALDILVSAAESFAKDNKSAAPVKDGFAVTYAEFAAAAEKREGVEALVRRVNELTDIKGECAAEQTRLARAIAAAKPYRFAALPFESYADTLHTRTRLGVLAPSAWDKLKNSLDEMPLVAYTEAGDEDGVLVAITAHRGTFSEVESLLASSGFTACPYTGNITGGQQLAELNEKLNSSRERQREAEAAICELAPSIRDLKIYCDYINFELEKEETAGKLRGTERTVFIEAFVPAEEEQKVTEELEKTGYALWYEFSDPAEDEEIPTLLKNNPVITGFESITNMYSPPSAREFDPNTIMAFFYSLFLGFIMGDIGYGLLMTIGGGILWYRSRKGSGLKNLSGVFAVGGLFTIFWGFLFNSFFGVALPIKTVMPNPQSDVYSIMGIQIPAVLVIAMFLGIAHLCAGYACKAWQEWRLGHVFDGIFDGLIWAIFAVGTAVAVAGMVEEFNLPQVLIWVGGITAGASLFIAAVTAGRKEKLVGKFTKGFGSVYGIINYVSDILSYARLYGLMLSGVIIAQIISGYVITGYNGSTPFLFSRNVFMIILGIVLLVVGHVFNIAIGLLGAYIHDARLQYVEFYGRFYSGEGELFTPLGSKHKHIYLNN